MVGYGFFAVIWIHEKLEIFSESPGHQSCSCLQLRSAVYGCSIRMETILKQYIDYDITLSLVMQSSFNKFS